MKRLPSLVLLFGLGCGTQLVMADTLPLVEQTAPAKVMVKKCLDGSKHCVSIDVQYPITNVAWINKSMEQRLKVAPFNKEDKQKVELDSSTIKTIYESWVDQNTKTLTTILAKVPNSKSANITFEDRIVPVYQKGSLVIFKEESYKFMGGAHGVPKKYFITYDLTSKKVLTLQEVLEPQQQEKWIALLKASYKNQYPDLYQSWYEALNKGKIKDADFFASNNFLLTAEGISIYFDPYRLGPYAKGFVHLDLTPDKLKGLVKPKYLN